MYNTLIRSHACNNLTGYVTKRSPRNVVLTDLKVKAFNLLLELQNLFLKGKYECFWIYEIALNFGWFSMADNMLRVEIRQSIKGLEMGGFQNLWDRQLTQSSRLRAMKWPSLRVASPYISTNTLSPFFITVGITLALVGLVFIAEACFGCKKVLRDWSCDSALYSTKRNRL